MKTPTFRRTLLASYLGSFIQAVSVNVPPLLFVTFNKELGVTLDKLGLLISINFAVQILVDFLCARYVERIGYRISIVLAQAFSAAGLILMGILPSIMPNAFAGILIATILNAIGSGLIEVLVSPIVEGVPGDAKDRAMSILHSFYCWGFVASVLLSTLFFVTAGIQYWRIMLMCWAIIPIVNSFLFATAPINPPASGKDRTPVKQLFSSGMFRLLLIMMICAGAAEQSMSQWSSLFAEVGLNVSKTLGDLLGPCAFAVLMGVARLLYGMFGAKINISKALSYSAIVCVVSYVIVIFSPVPIISLMGCALCGLSVGLMWPGTLSVTASRFPQGGTAMFALLALAGDVGCSSGPGIVGFVSDFVERTGSSLIQAESATIAGLKTGLITVVAFPLMLAIGMFILSRRRRRNV